MTWIIWIVATLSAFFGLQTEGASRVPQEPPERPPERSPARLDPHGFDTRLREAERWAENGYYDDARDVARSLAAEAPLRTEPCVLLARIELASGRLDAALDAAASVPPGSRSAEGGRLVSAMARAELESLASSPAVRLDVRVAALAALGAASDPAAIGRIVETGSTGNLPHGGGRLRPLLASKDPAHMRLYEALAVSERDDLELVGAAGLAALGSEDGGRIAEAIRGPSVGSACLAAELAHDAALAALIPAVRERSRAKDESGAAALVTLAALTDDRGERVRCQRSLERTALGVTPSRAAPASRAIEALGGIDDEKCHAALSTARATASGIDRRSRAARALAASGDAQGLDDLIAALEDTSRAPSWKDARAIGALHVQAAEDRLRHLLEGPDERVRAASAVALARMGAAGRFLREMSLEVEWARKGGGDEARLELAEALFDGSLGGAMFSSCDLVPSLRIDVPAAVNAPDVAAVVRMADAIAEVIRRLADEHETVRTEDTSRGGAVVYLRGDLTHERLAQICERLGSEDYEIELVGSPTGEGDSLAGCTNPGFKP